MAKTSVTDMRSSNDSFLPNIARIGFVFYTFFDIIYILGVYIYTGIPTVGHGIQLRRGQVVRWGMNNLNQWEDNASKNVRCILSFFLTLAFWVRLKESAKSAQRG